MGSDYGGPTLLYPLQQERARRPDRNLNVYGVTKHAIEGLKVSGRYREHAPTHELQRVEARLHGRVRRHIPVLRRTGAS